MLDDASSFWNWWRSVNTNQAAIKPTTTTSFKVSIFLILIFFVLDDYFIRVLNFWLIYISQKICVNVTSSPTPAFLHLYKKIVWKSQTYWVFVTPKADIPHFSSNSVTLNGLSGATSEPLYPTDLNPFPLVSPRVLSFCSRPERGVTEQNSNIPLFASTTRCYCY